MANSQNQFFLLLGLWLVLLAGGCDPQSLSDASKQARIAELMAEYRQSFPEVPAVQTDEVERLLAEQAVLVDARSEEEQAVSRLPGAIPKADFTANLERYADRPVIVYCTIGYRSGVYAAELREEGIDAYNYEGSILAWTHAGKALETPDGEATKRLHVYGRKWALQNNAYEAVW